MDQINRDRPNLPVDTVLTLACPCSAVFTDLVDQVRSLLPWLTLTCFGNLLAKNLFVLPIGDFMRGLVQTSDPAFEINYQDGEIDRIKGLPPFYSGLLNRSVHASLFFIEELALSNVGSDHQPCVLPVEDQRMRSNFHVDDIAILLLVPPRAGQNWSLDAGCRLD